MNIAKQSIAYLTIVRIEIMRMIRIWPQVILPPVVTSILYFVVFGRVMGARIGGMEGYPYITFIAPGLIMMNVIMTAYASTSSWIFISKMHHNIEELLVAPLSNITLLLGYMSTGIFRGMVIGSLVFLVSLIFAHLPVHSVVAVLLTALLASSIFSLLGIINAIYAKNFDDISIIPTFVLTPLTYLGGVFYSISLLPAFWKYCSYINPIVYIIDNFRYGFLGLSHGHLIVSYACMILFTTVLYGIAFYLIKKGIGIRN